MALVRYGQMVGQASGSLGATVFSHNRYGPYVRNRSIPTTSTTSFALAAKARFSAQSAAFQGESASVRLAWDNYAAANPIRNRLGETHELTGAAAYTGLNSRLDAAGFGTLTNPPLGVDPPALTTLSLTADIGAGAIEIAYTATPLAATHYLFIQAISVGSAGINYIKNLLKFIGISPGLQASPFDIEALVTARIGLPSVGETLHVQVSLLQNTTGFLSQPIRASAVVVTT